MQSPTVSIIIPTCNGLAHLEECFRSLRGMNYPSDKREIILVDNGSSDGSVEYVRESYPEATVVRNEKNEGFAGPCNLAAERSQSEYLAFLNNDTRVHPEWLNELTRSIESPKIDTEMVACVAGKIVSWDGHVIDYDGGILNFHGHGHHLGLGKPASAGTSHEQLTIFASAASMLIRRDIFLEVGGFDRDYFAYFEDVDLGWRLWLLGFQVLYCPTAVVFHKGRGTAALSEGERKKLLERNGLFTVFKNYSDANLEQVLLPALSLSTMKASIDREHSTSYLEAINEFFTCLDQLRLKRHDIQRRRKLDDEKIFPLFREPFRPSMHDASYWSLQRKLVRSFGLEEKFFKEGGLMKEQLIGYENLIEDLYRLQRETANVHGVQLAEARRETEALHGQLAEAQQEGERLRARARELEALVQARDGQLAQARQEAETLRARARELEALVQARDGQLAEARGRLGELKERNQLLERSLQDYMRRVDEFITLQNRRLSTRIINFLFWSGGQRP